MKFSRLLAVAALAAFGALVGGASVVQATPMAGLLSAAPAVRTLEKPDVVAVPIEKSYYYYRRHYRHPYYHRRYYHRYYYHPRYYRRHYYHPYYHRYYYHPRYYGYPY